MTRLSLQICFSKPSTALQPATTIRSIYSSFLIVLILTTMAFEPFSHTIIRPIKPINIAFLPRFGYMTYQQGSLLIWKNPSTFIFNSPANETLNCPVLGTFAPFTPNFLHHPSVLYPKAIEFLLVFKTPDGIWYNPVSLIIFPVPPPNHVNIGPCRIVIGPKQ